MKRRLHAVVVLTLTAAATAACGSPALPVSPGPPPASVPFAISGQVFGVTPSGRIPLSGATIQGDGLGQVVTDSDGAYEIRGTSFAYYVATLKVRKGGYAIVERPIMLSANAHLDIDLAAVATTTLSGVISETGATGIAPARGVLLEVLSCQDTPGCGFNVFDSTTTDANGAFSIHGLYSGKGTATVIWLSRNGQYYQDTPPESKPCDSCFRVFTIEGDTELKILLQPASTSTASGR